MKMGDSLGRSRKRRRKPAKASAESAQTPASEAAPEAVDQEGVEETARSTSAPAGRAEASRRRGPMTGSSRRVLLGIVVGVVFVGWFAGYNVATHFFFPAPPPPGDLFEVPDLRGLGFASAGERLAGAGLALGSIDSLSHPTVAAGLILGQSPLPGQVSQPETPVRVTVSMGSQTRSVPDVRRLDEARARIVLETSGFVVTIGTIEAEEPRGRVVRMSPPPGRVVDLPAAIELLVSTGPPVVSMPFVLGLEQSEAVSLIESLGLSVSTVEEVFRFGRDQGIVVEQEPAVGVGLRRGGGVSLKVGRSGGSEEQ